MNSGASKRDGKVLLLGPVPPPYGGQSVLVESILQSRLKDRFGIIPLDCSHDLPGGVKRVWLSLKFSILLIRILLSRPGLRILHIHTSAGKAFFEKSFFAAIGRLFGKKIILHVHGGKSAEFWALAGAVKRRLIRYLLSLYDTLIVLSPAGRELYKDIIGFPGRVNVLPNAIRAERFEPAAKGRDRVTALFVGHLKPEKGLLDLFAALQVLPSSVMERLEVRIVGAADTRNNTGQVAGIYSAADLSTVRFVGLKTGAAKWREYADADIFLLPSHTEDMPITVLEAMSCGLPVLATSVGSIPELIREGENGFLVPPHAPKLIAERIVRLFHDEALRKRMGIANRRKAELEFGFGLFENRLGAIYESLL